MIPTEQNDRLLELAGGCRHDYYPADTHETMRRNNYRQALGCKKCGLPNQPLRYPGWGPDAQFRYSPQKQELIPTGGYRPAVGDGHQMTLGEMVRLAAKLQPDYYKPMVAVEMLDSDDEWYAEVGDGFYGPYATGKGNTPEAALAAAILAAVDGAK